MKIPNIIIDKHIGHIRKRKWYKVRWSSSGKIDLVMDSDLEKIKLYVEILQEIETDMCKSLKRRSYTQEEIDQWIKENGIKQA